MCKKKEIQQIFFIKKIIFPLGLVFSSGELKRIAWGNLYKQISGSILDFTESQPSGRSCVSSFKYLSGGF